MVNKDIYSLVNKKVLVTGGGGFIGTNISRRLVEENAIVTATYHNHKPRFPVKGVSYLHADLINKEDCLNITKDMDYIIMTAAFVSGAQGMLANPMQLVTDTVILNLRVLESAYLNGVKKCIYISSGMVYPFKKELLKEEDGFTGEPFEKYFTGGWSRRFIEVVCRMYAEKLKAMDITVLRIDNLYGPYDNFEQKKSHVMPALIRKTIERMNPFEVWGDGNDYKDFIYIDDLVEGIMLALKKTKGYEVFNLASGKNVTIKELLEIILRCGNYKDAKIIYNTDMPMMIPYKRLSIEKAERLLGFKALTSLEDGIKKTMDWYRKNPARD